MSSWRCSRHASGPRQRRTCQRSESGGGPPAGEGQARARARGRDPPASHPAAGQRERIEGELRLPAEERGPHRPEPQPRIGAQVDPHTAPGLQQPSEGGLTVVEGAGERSVMAVSLLLAPRPTKGGPGLASSPPTATRTPRRSPAVPGPLAVGSPDRSRLSARCRSTNAVSHALATGRGRSAAAPPPHRVHPAPSGRGLGRSPIATSSPRSSPAPRPATRRGSRRSPLAGTRSARRRRPRFTEQAARA